MRAVAGSLFSRNNQPQVYKDILKGLKKTRSFDAKNKHEPHREAKEEEILAHLPDNVKPYSHSIYIVNQFWLKNIQPLDDIQLQELSLSVYCHLHASTHANAHYVLFKSNTMNVPSHIVKIFNVFEYVLRQISATDYGPYAHEKLVEKLKQLGDIHKHYMHDLDCNLYELILNALDSSLQQKLDKTFSVKVRLCFAQFFRLIVDIMNENEYLANHFTQIDGFICSLTDCLHHKHGSAYFKMFLEEQLQDENYLFYKSVQEYKALEVNRRIETGRYIIDTFIKKTGDKQVNLSASTRKQIINMTELSQKIIATYTDTVDTEHDAKESEMDTDKIINKAVDASKKYSVDIAELLHCDGFVNKLFDKAQEEIYRLMQRNSWGDFRNKILEYCGNDEFEKQQEAKVSQRQRDESEKRNLVTKILMKTTRESAVIEPLVDEKDPNEMVKKWRVVIIVLSIALLISLCCNLIQIFV